VSKIKLTFPKFNGVERGLKLLGQDFRANPIYYLARETIQNSLDAWDKDKKNSQIPVKIVFKLHTVRRDGLICSEEIRNSFIQAKKYWVSREASFKDIWDLGLDALKQPLIRLLEISDYNTYGLPGDDGDVGKRWHSLVKSEGVPNPNVDAGGSYGIGKMAPFACSDLRTVLYSTFTEKTGHAFQGVCRLATFEDDGFKRAPDGFIGQDSAGPSEEYLAVRDKNKIPAEFRRSEQGASVWCMGFVNEGAWHKLIASATIESFWMAIEKGHLEVDIINGNSTIYSITKESLSSITDTLIDDSRLANDARLAKYSLQLYQDPNHTLIESTANEEFYSKIGKVKLLIAYSDKETATNQCYQVRNNYMRIRSNRWKCPLDYTAILICDDKNGSDYLRALEPPSHEDWDPRLLVKNKTEAEKVVSGLEFWVKRKLLEHANKAGGEVIVESVTFDENSQDPNKAQLDIDEKDFDPFKTKKDSSDGTTTGFGGISPVKPGKRTKKKRKLLVAQKDGTVEGGYYYLRVLSVSGKNAKIQLIPSAEFEENKPVLFAFTTVGSDGAVEVIQPEKVINRGVEIKPSTNLHSHFELTPQMLNHKSLELELFVQSVADLRIGIRFKLPTSEPTPQT